MTKCSVLSLNEKKKCDTKIHSLARDALDSLLNFIIVKNLIFLFIYIYFFFCAITFILLKSENWSGRPILGASLSPIALLAM